jgi:hypothetical protein
VRVGSGECCHGIGFSNGRIHDARAWFVRLQIWNRF